MPNPLPTPTPPKPAAPVNPSSSTPVPAQSIPVKPAPPSSAVTGIPPAPAPVPTPSPAAPIAPTIAPTNNPVSVPAQPAVSAVPPPRPTPAPTPLAKVVAPAAADPRLAHMPPSRVTPGATRPISSITQPPMTAPAPKPVAAPVSMPNSSAAFPPIPPTKAAGMPTLAPPPPGSVPPQAPPPSSKLTGIQKSPLRFLPVVLGVVAILAIIGVIISRLLGGGSPSVATNPATPTTPTTTLTYWGLWEPSATLTSVFADFEQANPGIKVQYVQEQPQDYRERLQTAISQGNGPDLFRFHASWTPMLSDDLATMPSSVYTPQTFAATFYPAAVDQLTLNGTIRGVPLMYDGLGLYYNVDMLKAADAQPPKTWADLRILADKLTVRSGDQVQRGGLAIGNSTNVEHFADILALLMMQNGADMTNPTSPEAREALIFYTDFIKTYHVWSDTLPSSTVAFARGDAAMMLAPSWRAHEVIAQNPNLNFGIAPVPELGNSQLAWASYWAEGVNAKSKNQTAAWKLLAYLSSADVMKKMYTQQAGVRRFGEIYSRKDLANDLAGEALVAPYLSDAPNAKGWYMSSFTHDNGINDLIIKYYQDAITAVLNGTTPDAALQTVAQGVTQVLGQYGVPVTQAAPATTSVTPANSLTGL